MCWLSCRPSDHRNHPLSFFWHTFVILKRKREEYNRKMAANSDMIVLEREQGNPAGTMTESGFVRSVSAGGYDYQDGLSERELEILKTNIFGPKEQWTITLEMERLFKSTVELGFPQKGKSC